MYVPLWFAFNSNLIQMQNNRFEKIVTKQARLGLKE